MRIKKILIDETLSFNTSCCWANYIVLIIGPMQFALFVNLETKWSPSLKTRLTQKYATACKIIKNGLL